jgi:predicted lipoprotein with Yx(FWY)xxD motif
MQPPAPRVSRPEYRRYRRIATALVTVIAVVAVAGMALARSTPTLSIAKHVTVAGTAENVVATSHGLTVYTLSGESVHHLKCTKANGCFAAWPPVTTTKATSALSPTSGIHGALGELRRNGVRQLTLGSRPLYTFVGDGGKPRHSSGEGIASFGGIWHVVATSRSPTTAPNPAASTTSSTSSNPYPGYP